MSPPTIAQLLAYHVQLERRVEELEECVSRLTDKLQVVALRQQVGLRAMAKVSRPARKSEAKLRRATKKKKP